MHQRGIADQRFDQPAGQIALTEYQLTVQAAEQRVQRLTRVLRQATQGWRFEPVMSARRALRGIDTVSAIAAPVDQGGMELPLPGTYQQRTARPQKIAGAKHPHARLEGAGTLVFKIRAVVEPGRTGQLSAPSEKCMPG